MAGVLDGVRVLDFGRYIAGPYCACLLGDLGAEVIRVERVGGGEDRFVLPLGEKEGGAMFLSLNRNKQSLTLDPTTPDGRRIVRELVATVDIVVANLPPKALVAMGLDYDSLTAIKEDIILTSLNAFGTGGPWTDRLGFDGVAQAMSGLVYMTGQPGDPQKAYGPWVDFSAGTFAAYGTLAALMHKRATGKGQHVESSLIMAALTPAVALVAEQKVTNINRGPTGNRSQTGAPADMFATTDGWLIVQVVSQALYKRWARLMGEDHWLSDPRFKDDAARSDNAVVLSKRMSEWCATRSSEQALAELDVAGVPAGPVLRPAEVLEHEHLTAIGAFQDMDYAGVEGPVPVLKPPVTLSATPASIRTTTPQIGEHTDAILSSIGYDPEQIAALRAARQI